MALCRTFHVALGANLDSPAGPPARTLAAAIRALVDDDVRLRAVSRFFATPCFPPGAGPDYVNAAVTLASDLDADALLDRLHRVEAAFRRSRAVRWGMRTLDLDLIGAGDRVVPDVATVRRWMTLPPERQAKDAPPHLVLPHPRMHERAFVLVPLADIAPGWYHPLCKQTVAEMLAALPQDQRHAVVSL